MRSALAQTPYSGFVANNNKHPKQVAKSTARPSAAGAPQPAEDVTRAQRLLSWVGFSVLGFGILSLFALLLGESLTPVSVSNDSGIWAVVAFIPDIAIPLGFLMLIALLIISFRRRAQAAKVAGK